MIYKFLINGSMIVISSIFLIILIGCHSNSKETEEKLIDLDSINVNPNSHDIAISDTAFNWDKYKTIYSENPDSAISYFEKYSKKTEVQSDFMLNDCEFPDFSRITKHEVNITYKKLLLSTNDNCVLFFLDSLSVIKDKQQVNEIESLIHSLGDVVDGYVSEYYCLKFPEYCDGIRPIGGGSVSNHVDR